MNAPFEAPASGVEYLSGARDFTDGSPFVPGILPSSFARRQKSLARNVHILRRGPTSRTS